MARYRRDSGLDCKVYVGDLPRDASEKDIERAFSPGRGPGHMSEAAAATRHQGAAAGRHHVLLADTAGQNLAAHKPLV
ncbi:hypothetical protein LSH36_121g09021 [Paralvinella palmiformis]|uniref:RRM domain-containing protein n=1 Tax=Paralvinella palmiformis TaxID=53620 RepID=A0AAD9N8U2_9ANNE|nr:hypothetical protein LSH36_121g09021 [Paralvinella palmiformis]